MTKKKRKPNLVGLIVIGCGLVAVGISTGNVGLLGAGGLFIIIGAAGAVKAKQKRDTDDTGDDQQQD